MSSYHLSSAMMPSYLDALRRYRIEYLWGYPSSLCALAETALSQGRSDLKMRVAITNAEPLSVAQRDTIAAAFGCSVRETYGMAELVAAASECEAGRLHLWPEIGAIELHDVDPESGAGDFVCTGLLNDVMPLIRYKVGDRGTLAEPQATCGCGRTLPVLQSVDGRDDDVLVTRDGRRVGRLDPVFKTSMPVREAQIIQESLTRIRVKFVPGPGFHSDCLDALRVRLCDRLGPVDVVAETVQSIPRTRQGKFRSVICNVPQHERRMAGAA
jgi:phenylacetate-CoA ligase